MKEVKIQLKNKQASKTLRRVAHSGGRRQCPNTIGARQWISRKDTINDATDKMNAREHHNVQKDNAQAMIQ